MKYVFACLAGLLVGLGLALAGLFFNPLTGGRAAVEVTADLAFDYTLPPGAGGMHTHGPMLPTPSVPPGVPELWEDAIDSAVLSLLPLTDGSGDVVAGATRMLVPSGETNLVLNGIVADDTWLVSVPGRGSLFVVAETNLWPLIRDSWLRVTALGRPFEGPAAYAPTLGPGPGRAARVLGATGEFAGVHGDARERFELERYSAAAGLEALSGELAIVFDAPPAEAAAGDVPEG